MTDYLCFEIGLFLRRRDLMSPLRSVQAQGKSRRTDDRIMDDDLAMSA